MTLKSQTLQATTSSAKHSVRLKLGKEKSLLRRHPWIFSGAIEALPPCLPGEIFPVYSATGEFLAQAYFHPDNSLTGRVLSFTEEPIPDVIRQKLLAAAKLRQFLGCGQTYRLVNAEEDGLPGLIIDVYQDVYVLQVSTCGMERLKRLIVDLLVELFEENGGDSSRQGAAPSGCVQHYSSSNPLPKERGCDRAPLQLKTIYEKSSAAARDQEGLAPAQGLLFGAPCSEVTMEENGLSYLVSLEKGQKTGFFLDQKAMRARITELSKGRRVLNTFAYTGGFSIAALKGGALSVDSVDSDDDACALLERNLILNHMEHLPHRTFCKDVFDFLKTCDMNYDLIILDPPAFAKKRTDVDNACKGFKELHKLVFSKLKKPSLELTSSFSYHIDEALLQNLVFQSALESGVEGKIIDRHHLSPDHPIALTHPEGGYMKSLYLYIEPKNIL